MIVNPLSMLALAASNVVIPPTTALLSIPLSLLDPGTELEPTDAGSIPAPSESTRKTSKTGVVNILAAALQRLF
ncbi:hypothetical protein EDB19DRAFT_1909686 [Suillus lakei]|nr:hypothetical protein EDB19DRAFT_1909686 [Suillus lakei]